MKYKNVLQSKAASVRSVSLIVLLSLFFATTNAQVQLNGHWKQPSLSSKPVVEKTEDLNEGLSQSQQSIINSHSTSYIWDTQFATNGLNDDVYVMIRNGSDIYVGGELTTAGGNTANYIAKWDGTKWDSLGGGTNFLVWALAFIETDLYVGGSFTTAGGVTVNGIAKWDGTNWSALGSGVTGSVYALAVNGTDLYVGGSFTTAGGVPANGIAKWDGTNWFALGSGMDMAVYTLATIGSTVYAGGPFTTAGGTPVNYIAKWNGTSWSALGSGLTYQVETLLADNTILYVGGDFAQAGGIYSPGVAKWNGTAWSAMGGGINSTVRALSVQGSKLYAGGYELYIWDGTSWTTNGNSPNNLIFSLIADVNDTIYAGGQFTSTANTPSLHFGRCFPVGKAMTIESRGIWRFGEKAIGSHFSQNMKVYNTGIGENLSVSSVTSSLPDFTISPTTASIAPGDSFAFQITFAPQTEGELSSTITYTHDAYNSPSTVTVTGTGLPEPPPKYFRTARYENWATATDIKGKRTSVKRKFDKVFFKFILKADTSRPLLLDFGMFVNAVITRGILKTDTIAVITNVKKWIDSLLTVSPGETLQVDGIGNAGKKITVKYQWGKKKAVTMKDASLYQVNQLGLPMPNLHNIGEELFPKGFGNTTGFFSSGLTIGLPVGAYKPNTVLLKKYADVQKSFVKAVKNGILLHSDTLSARCLDSLDGVRKKAISVQLTSLPPDKQNNKLFAEAVTLKLNIAASLTEKFPTGLGELIYDNPDDTTNPLNGEYVLTISELADWMLQCKQELTGTTATFEEFYDVMRSINVAFADSPYTIDTISFGAKTKLTGVRTLLDVNYLHLNSGVEPKSCFADNATTKNIPEELALHQNYPNPFNPSTSISFDLPEDALVTLKVYDLLGREMVELMESQQYEAGSHEIHFDAGNLASGMYFYRITAQGVDGKSFSDVKKMLLLR